MKIIQDILFDHRDEQYASFQAKLLPSVPPESVIGIRLPEIKSIAKEIKDKPCCREFLSELPHEYYDENQLHAFVINLIRDFQLCLQETEKFLPYVDNWAVCDSLSPAVFKKKHDELIPFIKKCLESDKVFTVRFAVNMLMKNYLDDYFRPEYIDWVASKDCDEYYVNMGVAWYMSFALVKQWDDAVKLIESGKLSKFTQNKSIQKSIESYRLTQQQKDYLGTLKKQDAPKTKI